jgi:hypothetical protein
MCATSFCVLVILFDINVPVVYNGDVKGRPSDLMA